MKIGIRADGGSNIGMGHIMRTLVLAKELAETNDVFYICKRDNCNTNKFESGINKVKSEGFKIHYIDEVNFINDLKVVEADMLITDSYDVDENYFNETKKIFRKTGYIDDMNLHYFNVDFIINQNINAEDFVYKTNKETKLFLGHKYIMLREAFRKASQIEMKKEMKNILITMGGADPHNTTSKILDYCSELDFNFNVIVGPSFNNIEELNVSSKNNDKINLFFNADMYTLMQNNDLAISSCGSTLYELAVCGLPSLGIILAKNQEAVAKKMDELGLLRNLGYHNLLNKEYLVHNIDLFCKNYKMRKHISEHSSSLIDGKGVERLTLEINSF